MASDMRPLEYTPLIKGEIRLLYPTTSDSGTEWTLKPARLMRGQDEPPLEFDALSYPWGDLDQTFPLTINGQRLEVHHNLNQLLPYITPRLEGRPIWIDAICINQLDDNDKAQQLAVMAHIYRRAQTVWAWLGVHDDAAHRLLHKIIEVAKVARDHDDKFRGLLDLFRREGEPALQFGLPAISDPAWKGLTDLLQSSWFKRLWVVQESILARDLALVSGHAHFSPATVLAASAAHNHVVGVLSNIDARYACLGVAEYWRPDALRLRGIYNKAQRHGMLQQQPDPMWAARMLSTLTITAASQECREPRDRIFGLVGLIGNEALVERYGLLDVTKTPAELFTAVTHMLLTKVRPTNAASVVSWWNTLHFASAPGVESLPASQGDADDGRGSRLPSWVPSYSGLAPGYISWESLMLTVESAASQQRLLSPQVDDIYTLVVRGVAFDTVASVAVSMPAENNDEYAFARLIYWETMTARELFGGGKAAGVSVDAYWRLFSTRYALRHPNQTSSSLPSSDGADLDYASFCDFAAAVRRTPQYTHLALTSADKVELLSLSPYEVELDNEAALPRLLNSSAWGIVGRLIRRFSCRRVFTTVGGRIGFGPSTTRVGDVVCVLNTATVPHLLRKMGDGQQDYSLVGEAFVDGMMDGEVEALGIKPQDFYLK